MWSRSGRWRHRRRRRWSRPSSMTYTGRRSDPGYRRGMSRSAVDELADLLEPGGVLVLSGAGLSTESGIPDYRGPTGVLRARTPMTYQAFTRDPVARRRYWARSHLGWRTIGDAAPNAGHRAVARLQELGTLGGIITQNVDGLHQAGGARDVVELHGNLAQIACLECGTRTPRGD